jgi:KDO2-lipid IV(A) lauroyltransferase
VRDWLLENLLAVSTWLAGVSSIDAVVRLGAGVGRAWVRLHLPRVARVRQQLERAFPEPSPATLDTWTADVFANFGRSLAELILLRGRHRQALLDRVRVAGLEHLEAAERGSAAGGVLVVTAHYGNWELAGVKIASLGIPLSAIYRGLSVPVLDRALASIRSGDERAPLDYEQIKMGNAGLRLVRTLEAGRKVLVLLDQNARREEGVFVRFFGRPASVRTGPVRLATERGFSVLPAFICRDANGLDHRIQIHPPLNLERGAGDGEEIERRNLARISAEIEAQIRRDPGQWIWTHRRWRTQPIAEDRASPS